MLDDEPRRQRGQQYKVRLPDELHAWLKEMAKKNDRSMNYLIVKAVKQLKQQQEM
ncbi:MAG: Arc-like binding domain [Pseudomonadota bacterium]|jgi:predicted HicB family RNase H-like nuclease